MSFRKEQLVKGVVWSGIDKVGMVAIQLLLELVLARYVLPKEYGIIGLAMIFISLGTLFSESGFANALIHNQDRTEVDFSTAFYFNFLIALSVVLVVVLTAPYIAIFFNTPILAKVLKLISLCIIFNSLVMVHKTKLSISMDFKTQAKITFISLILSGIISVMMAINGYGVWALVVQILSQSIFTFLLFSVFNFWKPLPVFSRNSFKKLFGFGSHVLLAGIIQSIYINLYNLLIGKRMSTVTLGLYTKSNQFTLFPAGLVSIIFQRVTFPFFSSHQNDNEKIFFLSQSFTRMVGLVFFPFFTFLAVFSEPLVYYGLSESWIMAAPIVQLLAVAYMFQPIIANNMLLLQVKNNTKLYLKVEILTKISGIIILLSTINLGIIYVCYGLIIQLIIQLGITSYFCHMLLQKSMLQQLMIILPHIAMGIFTWILINFLLYNFSRGHFLLYGSILFVLVYICAYMLFFRNHIFGMYKLLSSK